MDRIAAIISMVARFLLSARGGRTPVSSSFLKWTLPGLVVVCLLAAYLSTRPPLGLIEVETGMLTPVQIRSMATTLLVHDDIQIRASASEKLASAAATAVPVLFELATTHRSHEVRRSVLLVLEYLDPDETARALRPMMEDEDVEVRRIAAGCAARLRNEASEPILLAAIDDTDVSVLNLAIEGCQSRRIEASIPSLKAALEHPNRSVQRHATRALDALANRRRHRRK